MAAGPTPAWISSARTDDEDDDPRPEVVTSTRPARPTPRSGCRTSLIVPSWSTPPQNDTGSARRTTCPSVEPATWPTAWRRSAMPGPGGEARAGRLDAPGHRREHDVDAEVRRGVRRPLAGVRRDGPGAA